MAKGCPPSSLPAEAVPAAPTPAGMGSSAAVVPTDEALVAAVRGGDTERFGELVERYQARLFGMARRHARREDEVEDLVQEIFLKAYQRLASFRGDAPFEHWLMRLAVRTCYDSLRSHQRNREHHVTDLTDDERDWLEGCAAEPDHASENAAAARTLVAKVLEALPPAHRLILTLLEIEDRSVKEVADLTGWSVPLVKVRAFRARAAMRKMLQRLARDQYL